MPKEIKLNDILKLSEEELLRTKIRFNQSNGKENPIDLFKKDPQELLKWNYWNSQQYKCGQISVGLVRLNDMDEWLLFTVGTILDKLDIPKNKKDVGWNFKTEEERFGSYFGRVIVRYHKKDQSMFRNALTIIDELKVKEILPDVFSGFDFPGYDKVSLTYGELETILKGNYPSYRNALENQQAVYVLTDTHTGKLYVGSATSKDKMLLARWQGYITTYHNGNEKLKELFHKEGAEYFKKHFKYSIIENYNSKVDANFVLKRESYWKDVLETRKFGYNAN